MNIDSNLLCLDELSWHLVEHRATRCISGAFLLITSYLVTVRTCMIIDIPTYLLAPVSLLVLVQYIRVPDNDTLVLVLVPVRVPGIPVPVLALALMPILVLG